MIAGLFRIQNSLTLNLRDPSLSNDDSFRRQLKTFFVFKLALMYSAP